jgi:polyferredoxin
MDKVGFKRGLIRYASENMIAKGIKFHWTPKALAYSVVLLVLVAIMGFSLAGRTELKTTVLRTRGVLYQKVGQDTIMNVYDVQIMNKRRETIPVSLKVESPEGSVLHMVGKELELQPVALTSGKFLLKIPRDQLQGYKTKVVIGVYDKEGQQVDKTNTVFLGPM